MGFDINQIRKKLHDNAEVSGKEFRTMSILTDYISILKPDKLFVGVGGCGVLAGFIKNDKLPNIIFRTDIDALPLHFKSPEGNKAAHNCGHDGHMAILLRFAEFLTEKRLYVNVYLLFQPAEEIGVGAKKILSSGLIEDINPIYVFGFHNLPGFAENAVIIKNGTFCAASMGFYGICKGRESHASTPEMGINPDSAIAQFILYLNSLNCSNMYEHGNVQSTTVFSSLGKKSFGTSAGFGEIMATIRSFSNEIMIKSIDEICIEFGKFASIYGLEYESRLCDYFPAVENNDQAIEIIKTAAENESKNIIIPGKSFRWSEDFSHYASIYKSGFFGIGVGESALELHHPDYDFNDRIIDSTANFLFNIAVVISDSILSKH